MTPMQAWLTKVKLTVYSELHVVLSRGGNKVSISKTKFGNREYIDLRFTPAGNTSLDVQLTLAAEPFLRQIAAGSLQAAAVLADWIDDHPGERLVGHGDTYIMPILRACLNS